ncbi:hypothetical protein NLJ89_g5068 [Agrocybe chaxingu]|uniref:Uncharacterized protein n=1 Tax=Agrocybe chaxingu TaxID=84603 RepID=A0A9W8K1V4_9AGAR|nr:hypothetical protein NLJ89_g5068 [Agrocybe chaxingu]
MSIPPEFLDGFAYISGLEPVSPSASPGTKEKHTSVLKDAHRAAGLLFMHTTGLLAASDAPDDELQFIDISDTLAHSDSSDESETDLEGVGQESSKSKPLRVTPFTRFAEIMNKDDEPYSIEEWLPFINEPTRTTLLEAEQEGFVRLLRGYLPAEKIKDMYNYVDTSQHDPIYEIVSDRAVGIDLIDDPLQRLCKRESVINAVDTSDVLHNFVHSVFLSMNSLRFAAEWSCMSGQSKCNAHKAKFRADVFRDTHPEVDEKHEDYKNVMKTFRKRFERVITARNAHRQLFLKFGAAVLLDPCWTPLATYNKNTTGRSTTFPKTLAHFMDNVDTPSDEYFDRNEEAFIQLVSILLPTDTVRYIEQFLEEYK